MTQITSKTPIENQRRFWNSWNLEHRANNRKLPQVNVRQAQTVKAWLDAIGHRDLDILEVGCGSGWLSEQLVEYGKVTGADLANEVLPPAGKSPGGVTYLAGNFFELGFSASAFDVVVSLEMLAHVDDQPGFIAKIADILRPGGHLMLATQNGFTLSRWTEVAPQASGQIRKWVDARQLRALLRPRFRVRALTSMVPVGDRGLLRLTNAYKLNRALSLVMSQGQIESLKERLLLGHTLMVLARKL